MRKGYAVTDASSSPVAPSLDEMLDLLPAAGTARRLTVLRPAGQGKLLGRCPVHVERTPSFEVRGVGRSGRFQRVRCRGCGFAGDAIDLVAASEGIAREILLAELPARLGLVPRTPAPRPETGSAAGPDDDF